MSDFIFKTGLARIIGGDNDSTDLIFIQNIFILVSVSLKRILMMGTKEAR